MWSALLHISHAKPLKRVVIDSNKYFCLALPPLPWVPSHSCLNLYFNLFLLRQFIGMILINFLNFLFWKRHISLFFIFKSNKCVLKSLVKSLLSSSAFGSMSTFFGTSQQQSNTIPKIHLIREMTSVLYIYNIKDFYLPVQLYIYGPNINTKSTLTFMVFLGVNESVKYIVVILVSTPIILNLIDLYEFQFKVILCW